MKPFVKPIIEIIEFSVVDIITTSGGELEDNLEDNEVTPDLA